MNFETVSIEKLVAGGDGLGRLASGEVVFVPWSAPGDALKLQVLNRKPRRGMIQDIVTPGPERVQAPCNAFGRCGGCQWQHISPQGQGEWKQRIVAESLQRIGKIPQPNVLPILSPATAANPEGAVWHYRNKVQWAVSDGRIGLFQSQSHDIMMVDHCWIVPHRFNELAAWLQEHVAALQGMETVQVRQNQQGELLLSFFQAHEADAWEPGFLGALTQAFPQVVGVTLERSGERPGEASQVLWGQAVLRETVRGKQFELSPESFFQVSAWGTDRLLEVLDAWLPPSSALLADLYAGVGLFSIMFAHRAERVVALEGSPDAVADARRNLLLNGCNTVEMVEGDVRQSVQSLEASVEVAIIDPPRTGCHPEVLAWLNERVTGQILYVSCDPVTLARDLQFLIAQGWQLEAVQPIDMFPQTHHVESVAKLVKASA